MKRVAILLAVFLAFGFEFAGADIIHIPDDYETIQEGIEAASEGDTVLVEPGIYVENINFNGHNIVLGSLFLTTGDSTYIAETVIDGDSSGSVVTFESGEDTTAVLTGFTIRNGYAQRGGGIYCRISDPIMANNVITENTSGIHGGGIYCTYCHPKIHSNIISSNASGAGAGIFCAEASLTIASNVIIENGREVLGCDSGGGISCYGDSIPIIVNNVISENSAVHGGGIRCTGNALIHGNIITGNLATVGFEWEGHGGGMVCSFSNAVISGNIISNNGAQGRGGGIYCFSSDILFSHNIVSNNNTTSSMGQAVGGGILCSESSPTIINSNFYGNSADVSGGGIYCELVSNPVITNTIFWADSAAYCPEIDFDDSSSPYFTYCDIQGGWPGEGNISVDPLFRDADNGDFHLMSTACGDPYDSPCIDAGDPSIFDYLLDCDWGLGEQRSDMGAYGGQAIPTDIRDEDVPSIPMACGLFHNYPNPFNATTTLRYVLPRPGAVTISVYNLLGQKVATIFEGDQQAGQHTIIWDAASFPSGVYFARLEAGSYSKSIKMVLLK